MSNFYQKCYNSADNTWKVCIVNWKGLDPKLITVRALRSKRWPHLVAYGCDNYVSVLDSRPYTLWEASDVSLTALSTLWECEGNSGRSSAGSQMPLPERLISCDQWVASVLMAVIFSLFLAGCSHLTERIFLRAVFQISRSSDFNIEYSTFSGSNAKALSDVFESNALDFFSLLFHPLECRAADCEICCLF